MTFGEYKVNFLNKETGKHDSILLGIKHQAISQARRLQETGHTRVQVYDVYKEKYLEITAPDEA